MGNKIIEGDQCKCKREKILKRICACIFGFILVVLFTIFIIWLVLRPTKPRFSLQDTSALQFNLSQNYEPYTLTSTLQVTVSSRNPNDRIGIYYDKLDVYAVYKYQQITLASQIQPFYQGHNDVTVWSPVLYGMSVPLAPYLCASLGQDQNAGIVLLYIRVDGKLRWKVGTWISGRYHIHVTCPAFLTFSSNGGLQFQQMTSCSVDI